ncbi:MAG: hypothetical protein ACHQNE_04340 [Candidatus Kapaibacterium sp.]
MSATDTLRMEVASGGDLLLSTIPSDANFTASPARPARVITTKPPLAISDQELRARVQWAHKTSSHFQISYDRSAFSELRAATLDETLEAAYSLIFHFTHEAFAGRLQVYAVDQRAKSLLGRSLRPHFNIEEPAIYLVENGSRQMQEELVELLTHAMRLTRYARHYEQTPGWAVLEEGFGIFLNERLAMQQDVFPFYGAESDLIAHHIYQTHGARLYDVWNAVPHALTTDQIVLAGAFLLSLGDTFSDDRVVTFSKSDYPITSETFRTFFDRSLDDLEAAWLQHLPLSLVTLTEEERERMIQHWDSAIECRRR